MELDGLPSTVMSAMTLTFDLRPSDTRSNQHIYEINFVCDHNWVNFPSLVFEMWC